MQSERLPVPSDPMPPVPDTDRDDRPANRVVTSDAPAAPAGSRQTVGRLIGVDAARGIAILGMFLVHVSPPTGSAWLVELAEGRSAALFAVLAGVSLALLSGGAQAHVDLGATRWRIVVRAVILMVLGLALALLHTSVMVILCYYALYFLLCVPLLRLRMPILAGLALITAIAGPIVSFAMRSHMEVNEFGESPSFDSVTDVRGTFQSLLLTGAYPVLTWIPFVLAGLALGRLGLHTTRQMRIVTVGAVLVVAGFGGSWFVQHVLGGRDRLLEMLRPMLAGSGISPEQALDSPQFGTAATTSWWNLTLPNPHSGTPFEVVGSIGAALVIIGACLLICRLRIAQSLLHPLIATGTMALTAYCLHIVILASFPPLRAEGDQLVAPWGMSTWTYFALLVGVVAAFATVWLSFVRRGPLETAIHHATARICA